MLPLHGLGHAADASARSRPRFPRRRTETFGHYGHARNQRRGFGVSVRVTVAAALGLGLVTDLPANAQFWGGWGNWGNSGRPQPQQRASPARIGHTSHI